MLPARNHAVVLVSKVHLPTLRALAYAQGTRPDTLTAVTVNVDDADTRRIQAEWEARDIPVPLTIIDSPYREITRPIIDYVKWLRSESPRDVVTVFIPEYVVGKWFENLLHNQSALRLKGRLLYEPGVMVTSVPWQLQSSVGKNLSRLDRDRPVADRGPGPRAGASAERPPRIVTRRANRQPDAAERAQTRRAEPPTRSPRRHRYPVELRRRDRARRSLRGARRRRPGGVRPARAARRAGASPRSPTSGPGYLRADAVEILRASPDRVDAAVPVRRSGPLRRLRLPARRRRPRSASSRPPWYASS